MINYFEFLIALRYKSKVYDFSIPDDSK